MGGTLVEDALGLPRHRLTSAVAAVALSIVAACNSPPRHPGPGVLRIGLPPAASIDPVSLRDSSGMIAARAIYETLVDFDPATLALRGDLAESWKSLDGGRRHRLTIRRGARFHDASPVGTKDVLFSLNRLVQKKTLSDSALLLDRVAGFKEVNVLGRADFLTGLKAVGKRTVEFRLSAPWHEFPYVLTHPATSIIPLRTETMPVEQFRRAPVGSGSYRVRGEFAEGKDLDLMNSRPGKGFPRVRLLFYSPGGAAWRDLLDGRLDIAEVPPADVETARTRFGGEGLRPLAAQLYLGFNLDAPDLRSRAIRRAVSLTIDRKTLATLLAGSASPARSLVPSPPGPAPGRCGELCRFDRARARSAVGGRSRELTIDHLEGRPYTEVAKALVEDLGRAGIKLQTRSSGPVDFFDRLGAGRHELFLLGWAAEYPLADWFLRSLLRTGSPDNYSRFSSPLTDRRLRRARAAEDAGDRRTIYARIETSALDEMALAPLVQFGGRLAAGPQVDELTIDPLGLFDIESLTVAPH